MNNAEDPWAKQANEGRNEVELASQGAGVVWSANWINKTRPESPDRQIAVFCLFDFRREFSARKSKTSEKFEGSRANVKTAIFTGSCSALRP
jgi:hypothetical protein